MNKCMWRKIGIQASYQSNSEKHNSLSRIISVFAFILFYKILHAHAHTHAHTHAQSGVSGPDKSSWDTAEKSQTREAPGTQISGRSAADG